MNALYGLGGKGDSPDARAIVERLGAYRGYLYFLLLAWKLMANGAIAATDG